MASTSRLKAAASFLSTNLNNRRSNFRVELTLPKVAELAELWYGSHNEMSWRKWTTAEAQSIFERVGLAGDFWQLKTSAETF